MLSVLEARSEIYNFFQNSETCQAHFFDDDNEDTYAAYYTSMYLLQDTGEGLQAHREKGFSNEHLLPYIEFWGVMQAIIIQQDSISELHSIILNENLRGAQTLQKYNLKWWAELRELRNVCAGHPANKDRPNPKQSSRSFMARGFGNYDEIFYEKFQLGTGGGTFPNTTFPKVRLGELIDNYTLEAEGCLRAILDKMRTQWPIT